MSEDTSYDDDDGGYDDSQGEASYSPGRWDPTETGSLLIAGRQVATFDRGLSFGALKAAVTTIEALGGDLTLVLPGDTSSTGPSDDEDCGCEVVVGVIVAGGHANDFEPARVDRDEALRVLAAAATRDHAAIAAALPEPLRADYLAATDALLLVPVGPLPMSTLVRGVAGRQDSEGLPGKFIRGVDMSQEGHLDGVWGTKLASGEYSDIMTVDLTAPLADGESYWLVSRYD